MAEIGPGTQLGPWIVRRQLGVGGNATVWAAARANGSEEFAVKVLTTSKSDREPYKRFVREVTFLQDLSDTAGILPLVDSHLPDQPSRRDRAWLAMPVATGVADALVGAPLESVVAALLQIATTLARLAT